MLICFIGVSEVHDAYNEVACIMNTCFGMQALTVQLKSVSRNFSIQKCHQFSVLPSVGQWLMTFQATTLIL